MGPGQLGHPVVEGHSGRQAGRGAAAACAGRTRGRAGEHRGLQGPQARRQAPKRKALGLTGGSLRVGMAAWPVLRVSGGACAAARGRPEPRARTLGRGVGATGVDTPAQDRGTHDEARHKRAARRTPRRDAGLRPPEDSGQPSGEHPYIDLRYRFADGRARIGFPDLIVDILDRLARLHGSADQDEPRAVGWPEFETTTDDEIETLDEALFDVAHLIAGLAAADGAVVMSKHNELLGFGGMISGRLLDVERVWRALDLEGERVVEEGTGNVGARHRSAYRLASALPGSVAVVISQDGGVRFVCQRGGRVTYWEQE